MNSKINYNQTIFTYFVSCVLYYVSLTLVFVVADTHGFLDKVLPLILIVLIMTVFFTWMFVKKVKQIIQITQLQKLDSDR